MNKFNLISLIALIALVLVLPFYARQEVLRMEAAQATLERKYIEYGTDLYLENCAECHGADGLGLGANPPLNRLGLAEADPRSLFQIIARAAHGTAMDAWHVDTGGSLSDLEIEQLVSVIRFADWRQVEQVALAQGIQPSELATYQIKDVYVQALDLEDPHQCVACHEDPEVHIGRFGLDCVRCHSLEAWTPALLTRHTFRIDHGDEGEVACQTCHIATYTEHTCYECHDHKPEDMAAAHEQEGIFDFQQCIDCHPTGAAGEAGMLKELISTTEGY